MRVFIKFLALALFGLATLGSGVCTAFFVPSVGREYVGWLPLLFGLPVFLTCALVTWLVWRSLRQTANEDSQDLP